MDRNIMLSRLVHQPNEGIENMCECEITNKIRENFEWVKMKECDR